MSIIRALLCLPGVLLIGSVWSSLAAAERMRDRMVEVDGHKVHLRISPGASQLKTIVFESGLGDPGAVWDDLLPLDANWGRTYAHEILNPPSTDKKLGSHLLGIPGTNLGDLPHAGGMCPFRSEHQPVSTPAN